MLNIRNMNKPIILNVFLICTLLTAPVTAAETLQVLGFSVSGQDITTHLAVNRGIDSAARDHGAPFTVAGSLLYPGTIIPVHVALKDTTKTGHPHPTMVTISFTIKVDRPPAAATDISGIFELTSQPEQSSRK